MVKYYFSSDNFDRSSAKYELGYYKRRNHITALIGVLCVM